MTDSRSARTHRAQCYRCFKPAVTCICRSVEQVANETGIIVLQHPRERFHAIGTVRIARLGLANVRVETCFPWMDAVAEKARLPAGTALLYPAPDARDLATLQADERPRHLLILDGTWRQAKKIYRTQPWLHDLPHVRLTPSEPSRYRLRREPKPDYIASLEAIVAALRILEPRTQGLDGLLRCFAAMIDQQATYTNAAGVSPAMLDVEIGDPSVPGGRAGGDVASIDLPAAAGTEGGGSRSSAIRQLSRRVQRERSLGGPRRRSALRA